MGGILRGFAPTLRTIGCDGVGQAGALNAGIAACQGELVCLLDADDVWDKNKIHTVVEAFAAHPQALWARHKLQVTDENLVPLGAAIPAVPEDGPIRTTPMRVAERAIAAITSGLVLHRRLVEQIFPLPVQLQADGQLISLRYDIDAIIVARIAALNAPGWNVGRALGYYRRHPRQQYVGHGDMVRT